MFQEYTPPALKSTSQILGFSPWRYFIYFFTRHRFEQHRVQDVCLITKWSIRLIKKTMFLVAPSFVVKYLYIAPLPFRFCSYFLKCLVDGVCFEVWFGFGFVFVYLYPLYLWRYMAFQNNHAPNTIVPQYESRFNNLANGKSRLVYNSNTVGFNTSTIVVSHVQEWSTLMMKMLLLWLVGGGRWCNWDCDSSIRTELERIWKQHHHCV